MPIALDPKQHFDYVLECDRALPPEQQTVFKLRGLTVAEEARIEDGLAQLVDGGVSMRSGHQKLEILRLGLLGWTGFRSADGTEVAFERTKGHPQHVTDACLDRLAPDWRVELANAITERGKLTPAEKN